MNPHRPNARRPAKALALVALALLASCPGASADAALAAPPADYDYLGGCVSVNVHQDDLTGQSWVGAVAVAVAATRDGVPFLQAAVSSVSCEFLINGVPFGTILTAPDGTFATAAAARFEYTAGPTDNAVLCTHATIEGVQLAKCSVQPVVPLPPLLA